MPPIVRKRFTFTCWKCHRTYSLFHEVEGQPVLEVECPYCFTEGIVDLALFRKKTVELFRTDKPTPESAHTVWEFPDVLPTAPPTE